MFGFGLSKRVEELEKELKRLTLLRIGEDNRVTTTETLYLPFGGNMQVEYTPPDKRPTVDVLDAFVLITTHLGLKFEVEPAKGEQVKLVKVKK